MATNFYRFEGINIGAFAADPSPAQAGDIYYNTVSTEIRRYNGTAWATIAVGTFANTTLSNLTNPTSINQDLIPDSDTTKQLGIDGTAWSQVYAQILSKDDASSSINLLAGTLRDSAGNDSVDWENRVAYDDAGGDSVQWQFRAMLDSDGDSSLDWQQRLLYDSDGSTIVNWATPGQISVLGNKIVSLATPTAGTDAANKNYVDNNAANRTLSNLTSPTSLNQPLIPTGDGSQSLGSSIHRFGNFYTANIYNASGPVMDVTNRTLVDGAAVTAVDFSGRILRDDANNVSMRWQTRTLNDNSGLLAIAYGGRFMSDGSQQALDWSNRILVDNGGSNTSLDWQNRTLNSSTGSTVFNWNSSTTLVASVPLNMSTNKITNVVDPTSPQDVATKNYVDTSGGGGGANTTLSNLVSPTAVNQDLQPASAGAVQLGSDGFNWATVYAVGLRASDVSPSVNASGGELQDSSGNASISWSDRVGYDSLNTEAIQWENRYLADSAGNNSIRWEERELHNSSDVVAINWENHSLYDNTGEFSVDYNLRQLLDSAAILSVDWENRTLRDTSGTPMLEFTTVGTLDAKNNTVANMADPTDPQDGATKNYVDTASLSFSIAASSGPTTFETVSKADAKGITYVFTAVNDTNGDVSMYQLFVAASSTTTTYNGGFNSGILAFTGTANLGFSAVDAGSDFEVQYTNPDSDTYTVKYKKTIYNP